MSTKYVRLEATLRNTPNSQRSIVLTFKEIEALLGDKLPKSAYRHRAWWSNQTDFRNRPQAEAWARAGFCVANVKQGVTDGQVSFHREGQTTGWSRPAPKAERVQPAADNRAVALPRSQASVTLDQKIVLISCVKSKRDLPSSAAEMYTSTLFRKMLSYAQKLGPKQIFILSAKYGLLKPDDMIEPYEQTLNEMGTIERQQWARSVVSKLHEHCNLDADNFVFLAGEAYRENIISHLKHYEIPMEGLGLGQQLQWLDRNVK